MCVAVLLSYVLCFPCCRNIYTLRARDDSSVYVLLHKRLLDFRSYVGSLGMPDCTAEHLDSQTSLLLTSGRVLLSSETCFGSAAGSGAGAGGGGKSRFMLLPTECCVWQMDCHAAREAAIVTQVFRNLLLPHLTADPNTNNNV